MIGSHHSKFLLLLRIALKFILTEIISLEKPSVPMRRISDVKPVGGRFILVPLRGRRDSQDGRHIT
jgi:hypothetical protein